MCSKSCCARKGRRRYEAAAIDHGSVWLVWEEDRRRFHGTRREELFPHSRPHGIGQDDAARRHLLRLLRRGEHGGAHGHDDAHGRSAARGEDERRLRLCFGNAEVPYLSHAVL